MVWLPQERLGFSVCGMLLILMLTGLAVNEILPLVRVQRPLDADPVLITGDLINLTFTLSETAILTELDCVAISRRLAKKNFDC